MVALLPSKTLYSATSTNRTRARVLCQPKRVTAVKSDACQIRAAVMDRPDDKSGGTGLLERPQFNQTDGSCLETESGFGSGDVDKSRKMGGGAYRVLLLDSEKHTEQLVVRVITTVVPQVPDEHARNCYHTSRALGMAIVTTALKEHAEFYAQAMFRNGCRASIEPDTSTI